MSQRKLLAVLGSPHSRGTTAAMLDRAVSAAQSSGWEVNRVNLSQKKLAYCTGCRACLQTKACTQKDDLQ